MTKGIARIDWLRLKAVIFDVDGTLYNQHMLCARMFFVLASYYMTHLLRLKDLRILISFRRQREKNIFKVSSDLRRDQYIWTSLDCGVSYDRVYGVVHRWIYRGPLKYISACRYPGVVKFLNNLHKIRIKTVVFSDYPAQDKLRALGISDCSLFCATDKNINSFKPNPKGLLLYLIIYVYLLISVYLLATVMTEMENVPGK